MIKFNNKLNLWERKCPKCKSLLKYNHKKSAYHHEFKNSNCRKCSKLKILDEIYLNKNKKWCRRCPKCRKELIYKNRQISLIRYHLNSFCKSCSQKEDRAFWYGGNMPLETRYKISLSEKGKSASQLTRERLSRSKRGNKNPFFRKKFSEIHRKI